ncbi:MAG TPA: bestrophin family ion channel [Devosiaceae bacterium]|nr:bestrophin family ion channel [Devosiaceae bacterium]
MYVGRSYRLIDFAVWSRRSVLYMVFVSAVAVAAYLLPPFAGLSIPWPIVAVLGTTVSLVAGFKSNQVFQRSTEALQTFWGIAATSRMLASLCCDFTTPVTARSIILRHLAWLTALRFSLRKPKPWETMAKGANREFFRRHYQIQEDVGSLPQELEALVGTEAAEIATENYSPVALLNRQARQINSLLKDGLVPPQVYTELMKLLRDCHDHQARCDRIKNAPYPRQYAIVSAMFVAIFVTLLPFGVVPIFAELARTALGPAAIWLSVPFSTLLGWMYMSLDQVSESTANPFEGSANDVPISQICRSLEIELRSRLGDSDLPEPLLPANGVAT